MHVRLSSCGKPTRTLVSEPGPAIATAIFVFILDRDDIGPLAYVAGSLGTLIGADLMNLDKVTRLGAPVVSMRRTASDLKIRLSRSENTSSPLALVLMPLIVTGPVCQQVIDELEGSTNRLPLESLSIRLPLHQLIWQVTPCTFGSATASTTTGLGNRLRARVIFDHL